MFQFQDDEKVILYVRKHWIWLFVETLKVFVVFIAPVAIVIFLDVYVFAAGAQFFNYPVTKLLSLFVYLWAIFSWMFMADRFTKYALNFWVLTNKKLIESEHLMLFSRKLSTLELESIEDVTVKFDGPLETILNFGSLTVQTAGTQREFLADDIKDPEGVKIALFDARQAEELEKRNVNVVNHEQISNSESDTENPIEIPHDLELPKDQKDGSASAYDWAK
jgi:membrane protein YdbS with pleckstrin-like domain